MSLPAFNSNVIFCSLPSDSFTLIGDVLPPETDCRVTTVCMCVCVLVYVCVKLPFRSCDRKPEPHLLIHFLLPAFYLVTMRDELGVCHVRLCGAAVSCLQQSEVGGVAGGDFQPFFFPLLLESQNTLPSLSLKQLGGCNCFASMCVVSDGAHSCTTWRLDLLC